MDIADEAGKVCRANMKSNASNFILTALLAVSLLASVIFCLQYTFQARELRRLSGQVNHINMYRNWVQSLAADCLQYSEKHPDINPILHSVGLTNAIIGKSAAK